MSTKSIKLVLALAALTLFTSACSISTSSSGNPQSVDSSVFATSDRGDTWRSMTAIPSTSGSAGSISNINVNVMTMDPSDNQALYLGSFANGLFYTYKISEGWNLVKGLPTATINDVKVDPKSKCNIYAAITNRVYRSSDCSRNWTQIYFDSNAEVLVNTIAIDQYNPNNVYIGTSRGEIIKTIDGGNSWRTIQRVNEGISRLIISPLDSRLIFVATSRNNIYSFNSNTNTNPANSTDLEANFIVENWTDLNEILRAYNLGATFKDIVVSQKDGTMFLATEKVMLRSRDNAMTWEDISLIQPEKDAVINAIAVDPENSNNLYYVTNTTFFRSADGGATWTTKKLPTKRAGRELLIDFKNPNVIYLGTKKIEQ